MKDYSVAFANTTGGVFPNTLGVNASGPSATDGTEFVKLMIDDLWGARQDLMVEAGKTPSGNDEAVGSSDFVAALKSLLWFNNRITGLVPSNNVTDSDHDIDVAVGQAMDSTNAYLLKLTSGLIKQIDVSWAAGTNAGGLFTGTVAVDTHYSVFLIRKDSDGSIDAGFDTSLTAANIPAGYTAYRRIGWVITDSSANILGFNAVELAGGAVDVEYDSSPTELTAAASTTSRVVLSVSVPIGCLGVFSCFLDYLSATTYTWVANTDFTDVAATINNSRVVVDAGADKASTTFTTQVNSSSQIAYRSSSAGGANVFISTKGYLDTRL